MYVPAYFVHTGKKIKEQLHCAVAINRVMVCGCRWFYCPIIFSPSCQRERLVKLFCQWNTNVCVYRLDWSLDSFRCENMDACEPKNTSTTVEAGLCLVKMVMSLKPLCQQWGFTHVHCVRSLRYRQKTLIGPWEETAEQSTPQFIMHLPDD